MPDISFIIPYRNREQHLSELIPALSEYLKDAAFTWQICVIEQDTGKLFNRAKLLNVGALEFPASWYVFHDVDMIPVEVDYSPCKLIKQLAASNIQRVDYLGGVTMFSHEALIQAGGYHNDYYSRAEDNEMMFNLKRRRMPVEVKAGTFRMQDHPPHKAFDRTLWTRAQVKRLQPDQLSCCEYTVLKREKRAGYHYLLVEI